VSYYTLNIIYQYKIYTIEGYRHYIKSNKCKYIVLIHILFFKRKFFIFHKCPNDLSLPPTFTKVYLNFFAHTWLRADSAVMYPRARPVSPEIDLSVLAKTVKWINNNLYICVIAQNSRSHANIPSTTYCN